VVITGASRGLGAACARAFARSNSKTSVVLMGRTQADLEAVAADICNLGGIAHPVVCDVTDRRRVEEVLSSLDSLDVLVNNAGTNDPRPFLDVTEESFDRIVGLNLKALFFTTQIAARHMVALGQPGVIVNVSSQMGFVGASNRTVYCASKHGVEGLTKAIAVELAPKGIRCLTVAPTFFTSGMATGLSSPRISQELLAQIPLGRFATTDEVAETIVFAASPQASLMTGTSLVLDGGWTAK